MCMEVFKHVEREKWTREFQPALVKLLDDKVVNVRFNAGNSILVINKICVYLNLGGKANYGSEKQ